MYSSVQILDTPLNTFLSSIITDKNKQTKDDIISGNIKMPNYIHYSSENSPVDFNYNRIFIGNLLKRYQMTLFAEEKRKLLNNVSDINVKLANLRNSNESSKLNKITIESRVKSSQINKRSNNNNDYDNYNFNNNNNNHLKNNKSLFFNENINSKKNLNLNYINNNKKLNSFNQKKNYQSQKIISYGINPIQSSKRYDLLKYEQNENDIIKQKEAEAFVKRLREIKNTNEVLKRKKETESYFKHLEEDIKLWEKNRIIIEKNKHIQNLIDRQNNKIKKYDVLNQKIVNKKYHYYNPNISENLNKNKSYENYNNNNNEYYNNKNNNFQSLPNINYNNNNNNNNNKIFNNNINSDINNLSKNDIFKDLDNGEINLSLSKYYSNINNNGNNNNVETINMDNNNNNSFSIINSSMNTKKSPYFFNDPKYNLSKNKLVEQIKVKYGVKKKDYSNSRILNDEELNN